MTPLAVNMTDAGALIGCSRWTVQVLIRQGMPFVPMGRKAKKIIVSEMMAWLKSRQVSLK